ncbi:MAG: hypothetical protein GY757_40540 [bacterium]|nr:hypothetical protein [bacterium]
MQANSFDDWTTVSDDRQNDAKTLLAQKKSTGSIYMAGYAVEARLKALLKKFNMPFPKSGSGGHNLKSLWKFSGFRLSDLKDDDGAKAFF